VRRVRRVLQIRCASGAWAAGRRGIDPEGHPLQGGAADSCPEPLRADGDQRSAYRAECPRLVLVPGGRCSPRRSGPCRQGVAQFAASPHAAEQSVDAPAGELPPGPPLSAAQPRRYLGLRELPLPWPRCQQVALALRPQLLKAVRWALRLRVFPVQVAQPEPWLGWLPWAGQALPQRAPAPQAWAVSLPVPRPPEASPPPWAEQL
jgi:hypothetical protein